MKPIIIENFADNGAHSHWSVVDGETGKIIIDDVIKRSNYKDMSHHCVNQNKLNSSKK